MMFDGLDTDGRGDMRFARAGTADEDDVVGLVEEVAAMKLTDQRLVDLTAGEVEAVPSLLAEPAAAFRERNFRTMSASSTSPLNSVRRRLAICRPSALVSSIPPRAADPHMRVVDAMKLFGIVWLPRGMP